MSKGLPSQSDRTAVHCPYRGCEKEVRLPRAQVGTVKCPHCGRSFSADTRVERGERGIARAIESSAQTSEHQAPRGASVTWSWQRALLGGAAFVGFGWLAAYLFWNEHEIWALLPTLLSLGGILLAARGRQGQCPKCGTAIHFKDKRSPNACTICGRYSRVENGSVKFVEPGFVAKVASFKVPLDAFLIEPNKLSHRWPWRWPRPGRCCVCGEPATRSKDYILTLKAGPSARGHLVKECRIEIFHCGKHSDGVVPGPGEELNFRSYDYWREFCALNDLALVVD